MIIIREAIKEDAPELMRLIRELAEFERAPSEVLNNTEQLTEDGWGNGQPLFTCFVAEEEHHIMGMALFHQAYSTWKGRYIYLDDLIVEAPSRGQGIGTMLFNRLITYCKDTGAHQLRWHVLNWNEPAIYFYKKYQASLDPDWITGKLHPHQFVLTDFDSTL
ncbi:MAG: GNAT family N-acetyltransferase [Bacteroidota bacterium]|jgi:GNAT superfamily N-acetyltransferase